MIRKIALVSCMLLSMYSWSQTGKISMEIDGINNSKGIVRIALYNNAKAFTKSEYKTLTTKAGKGKIYASFDNLPAGTYGVAILHDENKNDKMDFNMIGIPKEKYGFSRNPKVILSAPDFDQVAFKLKKGEEKKIQIQMK